MTQYLCNVQMQSLNPRGVLLTPDINVVRASHHQQALTRNATVAFSNCHINDFYCSEPRCAVALVSDGRTGPPDLDRGSPSCPPPTNDNPPADRGGADSETESDTDDP